MAFVLLDSAVVPAAAMGLLTVAWAYRERSIRQTISKGGKSIILTW